jgi:hypothetical protein
MCLKGVCHIVVHQASRRGSENENVEVFVVGLLLAFVSVHELDNGIAINAVRIVVDAPGLTEFFQYDIPIF